MPIGNVTSQLFANIYLQDLDFYVENIVKPKFRKQNKNLFYIRYVDDFVFLAEEKADLIQIKDEILEFLKTNLRLSVSPKKLVLNNVSCGIPFLRYIIWDRKLKIKNDTIRRFKKRIRFYPIEKKLESLISFKGHCELAKTKLISELFFSFYRKRVINIYKHRIEIFILYDSERGFRERIQREDSERGFRERIQREDSERGLEEIILKMNKSKFFSIIFSLFDIRLNNFHSINNKKAIGPVVATALLLVVAVVAVVGFQSWFSSYLSGVFSDIEIQSNSELDGSLKIESLIGDILYIINNIQDNLSIGELKIGGNLCTVTNNLTLGMNEVPVSSCISNLTTSTPDIVLITEKNVVSKTVYVKDSVSSSSSSLDCSTLNGGEWILVPGNAALGTSDFCVMKYEAKATTASEVNLFSSASMYCGDGTDGGGNNCLTDGSVNVTSKAASKPLTQVYQTEARQLCANLGVNYRLITDAEWVTIARNAENVSSNWADNTIGSTVASGGGLKRGNVGITDGASYNAASNPADRSLDTNSLAMFTLSNGETIWDLSGNVWEWTDDTFNTNAESALGQATSNWYEWTAISGHDNLEPFSSSLDANYGVGKVYTDVDNAYPSGTVHGFLRGGGWADGPNAGAFALALGTAPSGWSNGFGFRCSYAP